MCHECYLNANHNRDNWFVKPCSSPHLLVWIKQKNYPYWPAKLMKCNLPLQTVEVQFFGDHKRLENVSPKNCYMLSKLSPSCHIGPKEKFEASCMVKCAKMLFLSFYVESSLRNEDFLVLQEKNFCTNVGTNKLTVDFISYTGS